MAEKKTPTMDELCSKMDLFLCRFGMSNISQKANNIGPDLIKFLSANPDLINQYKNIGVFIEGIGTHWVNIPNPKVFLNILIFTLTLAICYLMKNNLGS